MKFTPLELAGAYTIEIEPIHDHRGFNARQWCAHEFAAHGLETKVAQSNIIRNKQRGTLRALRAWACSRCCS